MRKPRPLPRLETGLIDRFAPPDWRLSIQGDLSEERVRGGRGRVWLLVQTLLVVFSFVRHAPRQPQGGAVARPAGMLASDLRYAWRRLRRTPGFTVVALLVLGLGIGANSAVFSLISEMLLEPLPYPNTERLVRVYTNFPNSSLTALASYPDWRDYVERTDLFEEAALTNDGAILSYSSQARTESVLAEYYSANFLSMVGLQPALGRGFLPEEDQPARGEGVVMLSYSSWQRRFGGDPAVLGRRILLNGRPVTIVGVGPKGFIGQFPIFPSEFWVPLGTAALIDESVRRGFSDRAGRLYFIYGRLKPRYSLDQARAALNTVAATLATEFPDSNADRGVTALWATEVRIDPAIDLALYPVAGFLKGVVLLVLAVACSNLAGLQLLRTASRHREIALRQALGAGRSSVLRLLLLESALLGVLGGTVGLLLASAASWLAPLMPSPLPVALTIQMDLDWRVVAYTLTLSIATGLLFGLLPAWRLSRPDLVRAMKQSLTPFQLVGGRWSLRSLLIVTQVALSLVLLVSAGLFLRSLSNRHRLDPGFNTTSTALAVVDPELAGHRDERRILQILDTLRDRAAKLPGVSNAALTSRVPLGIWGTDRAPVRAAHTPLDTPPTQWPQVHRSIISDGYFETLQIPLVQGRSVDTADTAGSAPVAVVSSALAEELFSRTRVVGERLVVATPEGPETVQIVGVAADSAVRSLREEPASHLYLPWTQHAAPRMAIVVRSRLPESFAGLFVREVEAVDPRIPLLEARTMSEHLGMQFFIPKLMAWLLSGFGTLTLVLAGVGLYGTLAFTVARRTSEVGVRVALGARPRQIVWLLVRRALALVLSGGAAGLVLAWAVARPLSSQLVGVSPFDPLTAAAALSLLLLVAGVASLLPALRAVSVDPLVALRSE